MQFTAFEALPSLVLQCVSFNDCPGPRFAKNMLAAPSEHKYKIHQEVQGDTQKYLLVSN